MEPLTVGSISSILRSHYEEKPLHIPSLHQRELMLSYPRYTRRHNRFPDESELRRELSRSPPMALYSSVAYYLDPAYRDPLGDDEDASIIYEDEDGELVEWKDEPGNMTKKGWLGADLHFDIDFDHLPNVENYLHGLSLAAENAVRLYDMLVSDFGFNPNNIDIRFSGSRGFHILVFSRTTRMLSKEQRESLQEYVLGNKIHFSGFVSTTNAKNAFGGRDRQFILYPNNYLGWGGKFRRTFEEMASEVTNTEGEEEVERIVRSWIPRDTKNKDSLFLRPKWLGRRKDGKLVHPKRPLKAGTIKAIASFLTSDKGWVDKVCRTNKLSRWAKVAGLSHNNTSRLVEMVIQQTQLRQGSEIDRITKNVACQLRIPGSIHGGRGVACVRIQRPDLDDIDRVLNKAADFVGRDIVTIETGREVHVEVLDTTIPPGIHELPRWEAYATLFAENKAPEKNK